MTPIKFHKDRLRTVGADAHTRYLPLEGDGTTELRKAEYYVLSLFFKTKIANNTEMFA